MEEEILTILNKKNITEEDNKRLNNLFQDSQKNDNGKTYIDAYNKFVNSLDKK